MVDVYEMNESCSEIVSGAESLREQISELADGAEHWESLENAGWQSAEEILDALEKGEAWREVEEGLGVDPDEVEEMISCKQELSAMVDVFAEAAEVDIDTHEDAQTALEVLLGKGSEKHPGVVAAITLLVEALQEASILPRTEAVPAASNNTESTNTHSISATSEVEFSPGDSVNSSAVNPANY